MKKRNKPIIIVSVVALAIALILMLVGGYMAGWNFKEWFLSPHAYAVYSIVGLVVVFIIFYLIKEHIKKL